MATIDRTVDNLAKPISNIPSPTYLLLDFWVLEAYINFKYILFSNPDFFIMLPCYICGTGSFSSFYFFLISTLVRPYYWPNTLYDREHTSNYRSANQKTKQEMVGRVRWLKSSTKWFVSKYKIEWWCGPHDNFVSPNFIQ